MISIFLTSKCNVNIFFRFSDLFYCISYTHFNLTKTLYNEEIQASHRYGNRISSLKKKCIPLIKGFCSTHLLIARALHERMVIKKDLFDGIQTTGKMRDKYHGTQSVNQPRCFYCLCLGSSPSFFYCCNIYYYYNKWFVER